MLRSCYIYVQYNHTCQGHKTSSFFLDWIWIRRVVYLRSESNESIQSAHFRSESESLGIPIEYRTMGGGDLGMYPNRRRGTFHHIEQNTPGVGLCVRWRCRQRQQVPAIAVAYTAMPEFPVSKQFSTAIFR